MTLRLALLGAFSFPAPQGSQVFFREQAQALAAAGAAVTLLCYGHGEGALPGADLEVVRAPRWLSPRSYRSGLHPKKPFADLALAAATARVVRARRIDAVLAHNAEAALLARLAGGAPVVYVAHTLLAEELSAYGPGALRAPLDRLGARIDRAVARRAAAVQALSEPAREQLARAARGTVALIPPGVLALPPPPLDAVRAACRRHGLVPDRFALYAGNLDAYQELEALSRAAERIADATIVVATHAADARAASTLPGLRIVRVAPDEIRTLTHGAAVALATRRRVGGFPIKLLNYMEAGRAIVARQGQASTLTDGVDARLVARDAGPDAIADAIGGLLRDPDRARALGRAARATAEREHDWKHLAERTLTLVRDAIGTRRTQYTPAG